LILILFFFITVEPQAKSLEFRKFTVYAFIPWKNKHPDDHYKQFDEDLISYGIHPIKVIYEDYYLTEGKVDYSKIKKIAESAASEPDIPVSFDTEFGNRFRPETVIPKVQEILQSYRSFAPKALVGVYGTIPQTTFSWKPTISSYDKLNEKYKLLINFVDFLSPVLYNYDGNDLQAWLKSANYNINAANKHAPDKPIIPFISPIIKIGDTDLIKKGNIIEELSEESMAKRLQILYDLGASGCIIWASSQDRTKDGQFPAFNPEKDWGKAVVEFIKTHSLSAIEE